MALTLWLDCNMLIMVSMHRCILVASLPPPAMQEPVRHRQLASCCSALSRLLCATVLLPTPTTITPSVPALRAS
jgi:hypothetical protein